MVRNPSSRWQHRGSVTPASLRVPGGAVPSSSSSAGACRGPCSQAVPVAGLVAPRRDSAVSARARSGPGGGTAVSCLSVSVCVRGAAAWASGRVRHLSRFRVAKALGPKMQRTRPRFAPGPGTRAWSCFCHRAARASLMAVGTSTVLHTGPHRGSSKADDHGDSQQASPLTRVSPVKGWGQSPAGPTWGWLGGRLDLCLCL